MFVGKLVNANGISVAPSKIEAVINWPRPTNQKDLMSFLGITNYHRDDINKFADLTYYLYELAHAEEFLWLKRHEEALKR